MAHMQTKLFILRIRINLWFMRYQRRIEHQFQNWFPDACARCGQSHPRYEMHLRQTTYGRRVLLCDNCDAQLGKPFSRGRKPVEN